MAYAIEKGEPLSEAMPRIVLERIQVALEQLLDQSQPAAERIHNARKRFKESRAAVRLIRFSLGDQFQGENAWFRDAGRELASIRDADAVLEAADHLDEIAAGFHERRVMRRLRRRLQNAQRRASRIALQPKIDATAAQLPIAKARVSLWPPLPDSFETVGAGLRRTYRDGRRAHQHALESGVPEAFHDWRKRVKDHWYHVQILRNVWPAFTRPYRNEMEQLSDALGNRHDLDVLRDLLPQHFSSEFDVRVMNSLIDQRSDVLTAKALEVGSRIYAEPASAIYNRFEAYWTLWSPGEEVTTSSSPTLSVSS
jgi:CHAD domain-containing protein